MTTSDDNMPRSPEGTCEKCGYDMRGLPTAVCPECGTHVFDEVFRSSDPVDTKAAGAALADAGIEVRVYDSIPAGAVAGGWMGVHHDMQHHIVQVPRVEFSRAEEILARAGIASSRPIVDRSESRCPNCGGDLETRVGGSDGQCPACGFQFVWVDIDLPEFDPEGMACVQCGYGLTGNYTGRCPECNSPIEPTADHLVAQAAREYERAAEQSSEWAALPQVTLADVLNLKVVAVLVAIATVIIEMIYAVANDFDVSLISAVSVGIGSGIVTLLLLTTIRGLATALRPSRTDSD